MPAVKTGMTPPPMPGMPAPMQPMGGMPPAPGMPFAPPSNPFAPMPPMPLAGGPPPQMPQVQGQQMQGATAGRRRRFGDALEGMLGRNQGLGAAMPQPQRAMPPQMMQQQRMVAPGTPMMRTPPMQSMMPRPMEMGGEVDIFGYADGGPVVQYYEDAGEVQSFDALYDRMKDSGAAVDLAVNYFNRTGNVLDGYGNLIDAYKKTAATSSPSALADNTFFTAADGTQIEEPEYNYTYDEAVNLNKNRAVKSAKEQAAIDAAIKLGGGYVLNKDLGLGTISGDNSSAIGASLGSGPAQYTEFVEDYLSNVPASAFDVGKTTQDANSNVRDLLSSLPAGVLARVGVDPNFEADGATGYYRQLRKIRDSALGRLEKDALLNAMQVAHTAGYGDPDAYNPVSETMKTVQGTGGYAMQKRYQLSQGIRRHAADRYMTDEELAEHNKQYMPQSSVSTITGAESGAESGAGSAVGAGGNFGTGSYTASPVDSSEINPIDYSQFTGDVGNFSNTGENFSLYGPKINIPQSVSQYYTDPVTGGLTTSYGPEMVATSPIGAIKLPARPVEIDIFDFLSTPTYGTMYSGIDAGDVDLYEYGGVNNMRMGGEVSGPFGGSSVPRSAMIADQPHMLAYINQDEEALLRSFGGSGIAGPGGIPSYPPGTTGYGSGEGTGYGSYSDTQSRESATDNRVSDDDDDDYTPTSAELAAQLEAQGLTNITPGPLSVEDQVAQYKLFGDDNFVEIPVLPSGISYEDFKSGNYEGSIDQFNPARGEDIPDISAANADLAADQAAADVMESAINLGVLDDTILGPGEGGLPAPVNTIFGEDYTPTGAELANQLAKLGLDDKRTDTSLIDYTTTGSGGDFTTAAQADTNVSGAEFVANLTDGDDSGVNIFQPTLASEETLPAPVVNAPVVYTDRRGNQYDSQAAADAADRAFAAQLLSYGAGKEGFDSFADQVSKPYIPREESDRAASRIYTDNFRPELAQYRGPDILGGIYSDIEAIGGLPPLGDTRGGVSGVQTITSLNDPNITQSLSAASQGLEQYGIDDNLLDLNIPTSPLTDDDDYTPTSADLARQLRDAGLTDQRVSSGFDTGLMQTGRGDNYLQNIIDSADEDGIVEWTDIEVDVNDPDQVAALAASLNEFYANKDIFNTLDYYDEKTGFFNDNQAARALDRAGRPIVSADRDDPRGDQIVSPTGTGINRQSDLQRGLGTTGPRDQRDMPQSPAESVISQTIMGFEGRTENPYYDVNAYRAGYGSDTKTDPITGKVTKITEGMTVSKAEADADLNRRLTKEFIPSVVNTVGADTFYGMNPQQQAALTSIAYNYGKLPTRIETVVNNVDASTAQGQKAISDAIRSLEGDNDGINRNRRNSEADLFLGQGNLPETSVVEKPDTGVTPEQRKGNVEKIKQQIGDQAEPTGLESIFYEVIGGLGFGLGKPLADKLRGSSRENRQAIIDQHVYALQNGATPKTDEDGNYIGFDISTMDTFADKVLGAEDIMAFMPPSSGTYNNPAYQADADGDGVSDYDRFQQVFGAQSTAASADPTGTSTEQGFITSDGKEFFVDAGGNVVEITDGTVPLEVGGGDDVAAALGLTETTTGGDDGSEEIKNYTTDDDGNKVCNDEGYVYNSETDMCELPAEEEKSDTVSSPIGIGIPSSRSFNDLMASITTPAPKIAPISANIRPMQDGGMAGLNRTADNFLKALAG